MAATRLLAHDFDARGISRLRNIPDPVEDLEACNLRTARAMFEQALELVRGLNWKDDARVAFTRNVDLQGRISSEGGTVLADGDRVLLMGQDDPTRNGLYELQGGVLGRTADADHGSQLNAAVVTVAAGSLAGQTFRQSSRDPVIGLSSIVWTPFLGGSGAATLTTSGMVRLADVATTRAGLDATMAVTPYGLAQVLQQLLGQAGGGGRSGHAETIGDAVRTDYDIQHDLHTFDVLVMVRRLATNEYVTASIRALDADRVRVSFLLPPPVDAFRVLITPI